MQDWDSESEQTLRFQNEKVYQRYFFYCPQFN
jgi:hypothetical protein